MCDSCVAAASAESSESEASPAPVAAPAAAAGDDDGDGEEEDDDDEADAENFGNRKASDNVPDDIGKGHDRSVPHGMVNEDAIPNFHLPDGAHSLRISYPVPDSLPVFLHRHCQCRSRGMVIEGEPADMPRLEPQDVSAGHRGER